ncbi:FAD-dependent monooxygenase [Streptomyces sp. NPDC047706]|uniref:FAD-dependent monooxygenase n=1 Tax=Streptomyces sp. NPDC047706 TaxID=3365486 RepID=UPI003716C5EB
MDTDVLIVGAGPVGLTAAAELRRHRIRCRIVDRLAKRLPYAKAVGIQPRTLELWDRMGLVRAALDTAVLMRGQLLYVNGEEQGRIDLELPAEVPYRFAALPQYETERILEEYLARFGTRIERGTELRSFTQDGDGVTSRLSTGDGEEREIRSRFLVGCDGAHSTVRKVLGIGFGGGAFPEEYMLADVEVDWDLPQGYGVRAMHYGDGALDDLLVCIPLPGRSRYRMSMLVPPELSTRAGHLRREPGADKATNGLGEATQGLGHGTDTPGDVTHGLEGGRRPALEHIQAVLDRLSPQPTTASAMRWSSIFRISHRLADRYGDGRVFLAGDAAHIHPPTGAQGMNTGIQDACNLAWKLALAVRGTAHPRLLDSYDAERRPIGEEVVGRTVRHAREGIQADPDDPDDPATIMMREAQLLVAYPDSPVVGPRTPGLTGPDAGDRAPDCGGLTDSVAAYPMRLYDVLRERDHVLLLYADEDGQADTFADLAAKTRTASHDQVAVYAVLAAGVDAGRAGLPVLWDSRGEFRGGYRAEGPTALLVRPDGHLGARVTPASVERLTAHLSQVFGP